MKLAQALNLRKQSADQFNKSIQLVHSVSVQLVGDARQAITPAEGIAGLLSQVKTATKLIRDIDHTNANTKLPSGISLTQALAERDVLAKAHKSMSSLLTVNRGYQGSVVLLDLEKTSRILDDMARRWRELDDLIQAANWTTELMDCGL